VDLNLLRNALILALGTVTAVVVGHVVLIVWIARTHLFPH
jgi:hypothetical protein